MLTLILAIVVGGFLFYYTMVKPFHYWTDRGVKQGNPKLIFGDNWDSMTGKENLLEMFIRLYNQYPGTRYSGIYQFLVPTLLIRDPDLMKQITVKDFDHFTDHKSLVPEDGDPLWSKNLVALKGEKWRDMRSILSPSFTSSKMRSMFVLMQKCAENFVKHFQDKNEDIVSIELRDAFTRFTNDVIATTAFGLEIDSLGHQENEFYLMGKEATTFSGLRKTLKFIGFSMIPDTFKSLGITLFGEKVTNFFNKVVEDTLKIRRTKGIVRPDMIHLLLEAQKGKANHEESNVIDTGFSVAQESDLTKTSNKDKQHKEITDVDITAQAMVFFFAGFETVSGFMCFLAYELAANPDIQDKLRTEIKTTLEECAGKLTYEHLLKMKYLDMVVSETLRKWPIALRMDRVCTKPYTIEPTSPNEKPVHLKKGDTVMFSTIGIHRDPQYYPDPERFDPERFNEENIGNIKPYTYFPFGLGPRNCIGSRFALLEIKTIVFNILNSFEIVPVEKSMIPVKLSTKYFNLIPEGGGFWFGLKRISA